MSANYCSNCGYKMEGVAANFCPKCGQNLKTLAKTVSREDVTEGGGLDISSVKDKIKISVDFEHGKPVTIGDIIKEAKVVGKIDEIIARPASKDPVGNDLLTKIVKECASSRKDSKEIE